MHGNCISPISEAKGEPATAVSPDRVERLAGHGGIFCYDRPLTIWNPDHRLLADGSVGGGCGRAVCRASDLPVLRVRASDSARRQSRFRRSAGSAWCSQRIQRSRLRSLLFIRRRPGRGVMRPRHPSLRRLARPARAERDGASRGIDAPCARPRLADRVDRNPRYPGRNRDVAPERRQ